MRHTGVAPQHKQNANPGDTRTTILSPVNGWLERRREPQPVDITDLIGLYAQATTARLDTAIDAAAAAQNVWQAAGLEARQTALMKIGNALIDRVDELGGFSAARKASPAPRAAARSTAPDSSSPITPPRCCARLATMRIRSAPASRSMCAATRSVSSP